jgi:hypothetical protein
MSAALLGREAIDITASLADAAAPLAMGILEFTNASDLYCRHGGLLAAGSLRTRTGRPSKTRRAENKGELTKHLQRPQPPNGRLMLNLHWAGFLTLGGREETEFSIQKPLAPPL